MKRGKAVSCAKCGHTFMEAWPGEQYALRCENEKSGPWRGRVTELFRAGRIDVIAGRQPPAWCPIRKKGNMNHEQYQN